VKEAKVVEAYAQLYEPKRPAFLDGLTGDLEEMKEVLERVGSRQTPQHLATSFPNRAELLKLADLGRCCCVPLLRRHCECTQTKIRQPRVHCGLVGAVIGLAALSAGSNY